MFKGFIVGRLTGDPVVKQSQNGKNYAQFSIAVNTGKNQDGSDRATFVNVKAFNKQGEMIAQSMKKGHRIAAELTQLDASAWINQNSGQAQGSLNALLSNFDFIETKSDTQSGNSQSNNWGSQQQGQSSPSVPPQQPQTQNNGGWANQSPQQPPVQQFQQQNYNQPPAQQPSQQNYNSSPWG